MSQAANVASRFHLDSAFSWEWAFNSPFLKSQFISRQLIESSAKLGLLSFSSQFNETKYNKLNYQRADVKQTGRNVKERFGTEGSRLTTLYTHSLSSSSNTA